MIRLDFLLAVAALAAALSSCFPPAMRLRERTDPEHGAIVMAVTFKGRELPYWLRHPARELFFERVNGDGSLDPQLVQANYRVDDRLYALDLPAGRYALVAATYFAGRAREIARFDPAFAVKELAVDVSPGRIAFGGQIEIQRYMGDDSSVFWLNGLRRARQYFPPFKRALIEIVSGPQPRITRSANVEGETMRLARADLSGTFWEDAVGRRLNQLGNPQDPVVTGVLRKKTVPPRLADTFSYMDILGWGAPRRVGGGLEWRLRAAGPAVSIVFVPSQGPRGRSFESALSSLKEAGAPEDSHTLTPVRVSSRSAYAGLYTTYVYPEPVLLGSRVTVLKTEVLVVPGADGYYQAQYRAEASEFLKHKPEFERFVRYIDFSPPKKEGT